MCATSGSTDRRADAQCPTPMPIIYAYHSTLNEPSSSREMHLSIQNMSCIRLPRCGDDPELASRVAALNAQYYALERSWLKSAQRKVLIQTVQCRVSARCSDLRIERALCIGLGSLESRFSQTNTIGVSITRKLERLLRRMRARLRLSGQPRREIGGGSVGGKSDIMERKDRDRGDYARPEIKAWSVEYVATQLRNEELKHEQPLDCPQSAGALYQNGLDSNLSMCQLLQFETMLQSLRMCL